MITLYGSGQSRSFRELWALEEAGLPYDYKQVKIGSSDKNGTQTALYKQLNTQGKVPVLVADDVVINESAAILNYIAALVPDAGLIPMDDLALRAYYDEICFFVLSELEQPLWMKAKHSFIFPKEYRVKGVRHTAQWEFRKALQAVEHYLKDKQYAVGERFTMADILISYTLLWAEKAKFEVPENLLDSSKRLYLRPACTRALAKA